MSATLKKKRAYRSFDYQLKVANPKMLTYFSNHRIRNRIDFSRLFNGLLKPLTLSLFPDSLNEENEEYTLSYLETLFSVPTREIYVAKSKETFIMPGKLKFNNRYSSGHKISIKKNTRMYVRVDHSENKVVDIEVIRLWGKNKIVPLFRLTHQEYQSILKYMERIKRKPSSK